MTKNERITAIVISVLAVCILVSAILVLKSAQKSSVDTSALPVYHIAADLVYDPYALETLVGVSDYVFIATVIARDPETHYVNHRSYGDKPVADPMTYYTIQITENIKGTLQTDVPIQLIQEAGVELDGQSIRLYSGDSFLEVGSSYIISTNAQTSGDILTGGPNTSVLLETAPVDVASDPADGSDSVEGNDASSAYSGYTSESVAKINEFIEAYENEVVFNRERSHSIYEVQP